MSDEKIVSPLVAVIGAGPAGLYAAQSLARQGAQVVLFNRDIKFGGLAEYGIFPTKHKMRLGLLAHFSRILKMPNVHYVGNILVGQSGDITLDQLRKAGFQAFMVTTGAQKNHWLGLSGEDLDGVFQANEIVFGYNLLPTYTGINFDIGRNIAVIGVGNVMLDIMHHLKLEGIERNVTAYARRGPAQVKFDKETLEPVADCLDLDFIKLEVETAQPQAESTEQDVGLFYRILEEAREKAEDCHSGLTVRMAFLRSPRRMIGDTEGRVKAIVFEKNVLVKQEESIISQGTGKFETVPVDTVIFSIGSQVDSSFGLPFDHGSYVTSPKPRFPIDGISYEVYNPDLCTACEDIFVSGWARKAGEGVVGLARKDAEMGARAVISYLATLDAGDAVHAETAINALPLDEKKVIRLSDLQKLKEEENRIAQQRGLAEFKFNSNEAMLKVIKGN